MTNPYIDKIIKNPKKKSKKKGNTSEHWATKSFCILFVAFCMYTVLFLILPILGYDFFGVNESTCSAIESDAQNTHAALASYFSEPDKDEVPTLQDLVESEGYYINKNHTVIVDGTIDRIRVTVIDNKGKCPRGKKYVLEMGEDWLTLRDSATWYSE